MTCNRIATNQSPGTYALSVSSEDSDVTVSGTHGVNGVIVDEWTHGDLFNRTKPIQLAADESHQVIVDADFHGSATVTVEIAADDGTKITDPCMLTNGGDESSAFIVKASG